MKKFIINMKYSLAILLVLVQFAKAQQAQPPLTAFNSTQISQLKTYTAWANKLSADSVRNEYKAALKPYTDTLAAYRKILYAIEKLDTATLNAVKGLVPTILGLKKADAELLAYKGSNEVRVNSLEGARNKMLASIDTLTKNLKAIPAQDTSWRKTIDELQKAIDGYQKQLQDVKRTIPNGFAYPADKAFRSHPEGFKINTTLDFGNMEILTAENAVEYFKTHPTIIKVIPSL